MKIAALITALFYAYATVRIWRTWKYRDRFNIAAWSIFLVLIGASAITLFFYRR